MRKIFVTTVVTALCTGFFLVFLEMGALVYLYGWNILLPHNYRSIPYFGHPKVLVPSSVGLSHELATNADIFYKKALIHTTPDGLRDHLYTKKKPPQTIRIAVLGDSYVMPEGVSIEKAFHSIMEEEWNNQTAKNIRYEFINFGVSGYNLWDYPIVLREKVLQYHPDVIIQCITRNDHQRPGDARGVKSSAKWFGVFAFMRLFYPLHISPQQIDAWTVKDFGSPYHTVGPVTPEENDEIIKSSTEMVNIARAQKISIIFAMIDYVPLDRHWIDLWEKMAKERGAGFVDLSKGFANKDVRPFRIYRADNHPNAKAHRIFADTLTTYMRSITMP